MITHFLGGLVLGAFVKDWQIAIALIVGWEVLETLLITGHRRAFRENPLNKLSDLFFGIMGYFFGFELIW